MKILIKNHDDLTNIEAKAIKKLRLPCGVIGSYLEQAQDNAKFSPRLTPCTKIIVARTTREVLGWGLYTPEAYSWEELCRSKGLNNYYLQLYVSYKHRRKGIGTSIIKAAKSRAKRLSHQVIVFPHDRVSRIVFSKDKDLKGHRSYA